MKKIIQKIKDSPKTSATIIMAIIISMAVLYIAFHNYVSLSQITIMFIIGLISAYFPKQVLIKIIAVMLFLLTIAFAASIMGIFGGMVLGAEMLALFGGVVCVLALKHIKTKEG